MKISDGEFQVQFNQLEISNFLKFLFEKVNHYKEKELSGTELIVSLNLYCKSVIILVNCLFPLE